jgi:hypothetical protein
MLMCTVRRLEFQIFLLLFDDDLLKLMEWGGGPWIPNEEGGKGSDG